MRRKYLFLGIVSGFICVTLLWTSAQILSTVKEVSHIILFLLLMFFSITSLFPLANAIKQKRLTGSSLYRTNPGEFWSSNQIFEFANTTFGCILFFLAWRLPTSGIPNTILYDIAEFCYLFLMTIFLARVFCMLFDDDPDDAKDCQTSKP